MFIVLCVYIYIYIYIYICIALPEGLALHPGGSPAPGDPRGVPPHRVGPRRGTKNIQKMVLVWVLAYRDPEWATFIYY